MFDKICSLRGKLEDNRSDSCAEIDQQPTISPKGAAVEALRGFHLQRSACLPMLNAPRGHTCLLLVTLLQRRDSGPRPPTGVSTTHVLMAAPALQTGLLDHQPRDPGVGGRRELLRPHCTSCRSHWGRALVRCCSSPQYSCVILKEEKGGHNVHIFFKVLLYVKEVK